MAIIVDSFQQTFREFETPNLPSSGQRKVWKADARALGGVIEQSVNLIANGVIIGSATLYATKAAMDADYATGVVGRLALIYADPTPANNKIWVKGASAWVDAGMTLAASAVAQLTDLAARMSAAETRLTAIEAFQTRDILLDVGSTGDAIVGTTEGIVIPAATLLNSRTFLIYRPTESNTTSAPTAQINGDTQGRIIRDLQNVSLKIGDLQVGRDHILIPDGARYRLLNPGGTLRASDLVEAVSDLLGGASTAANTLKKIDDRLTSEVTTRGNSDAGLQASINAINTALAGLTIGEDVQAYDGTLAAIAGLATAANKLIYTTGADAFETSDLTAFARTLLDDASAAEMRVTLDLDQVENTSDADKPVSDAQQAALDLKASLAALSDEVDRAEAAETALDRRAPRLLTEVGGTPNAITATAGLTPGVPIAPGATFYLDVVTTNTGSATLTIDADTTRPLQDRFNANLKSGDLVAGSRYLVTAYTSRFKILSPLGAMWRASDMAAGIDDLNDALQDQIGPLAAKLDGIEEGADVTNAATVSAAFAATTTKAEPDDDDYFAFRDPSTPVANNGWHRMTWASFKARFGALYDTKTAIVNAVIKNTPVNADVFGFLDSENGNVLSKVTFGNFVTAIRNALTSVFQGRTGVLDDTTASFTIEREDELEAATADVAQALGYIAPLRDLKGRAYTRPGDAPYLFSNQTAGKALALPPLAHGVKETTVQLGSYWRIRAEDIDDPTGWRDLVQAIDFEIKPGRTYLVETDYVRIDDPSTAQPVKLRWFNLNGNGNAISDVDLKTDANPLKGQGPRSLFAFIGKQGAPLPAGLSQLDYTIAASTVYGRAGNRVFSNGQSTGVITVSCRDVTDQIANGADIVDLRSRIVALEGSVSTISNALPGIQSAVAAAQEDADSAFAKADIVQRTRFITRPADDPDSWTAAVTGDWRTVPPLLPQAGYAVGDTPEGKALLITGQIAAGPIALQHLALGRVYRARVGVIRKINDSVNRFTLRARSFGADGVGFATTALMGNMVQSVADGFREYSVVLSRDPAKSSVPLPEGTVDLRIYPAGPSGTTTGQFGVLYLAFDDITDGDFSGAPSAETIDGLDFLTLDSTGAARRVSDDVLKQWIDTLMSGPKLFPFDVLDGSAGLSSQVMIAEDAGLYSVSVQNKATTADGPILGVCDGGKTPTSLADAKWLIPPMASIELDHPSKFKPGVFSIISNAGGADFSCHFASTSQGDPNLAAGFEAAVATHLGRYSGSLTTPMVQAIRERFRALWFNGIIQTANNAGLGLWTPVAPNMADSRINWAGNHHTLSILGAPTITPWKRWNLDGADDGFDTGISVPPHDHSLMIVVGPEGHTTSQIVAGSQRLRLFVNLLTTHRFRLFDFSSNVDGTGTPATDIYYNSEHTQADGGHHFITRSNDETVTASYKKTDFTVTAPFTEEYDDPLTMKFGCASTTSNAGTAFYPGPLFGGALTPALTKAQRDAIVDADNAFFAAAEGF